MSGATLLLSCILALGQVPSLTAAATLRRVLALRPLTAAVCIGLSWQLSAPPDALAREGPAPKMEFFGTAEEPSGAAGVYDESDRSMLLEKAARCRRQWGKLSSRLDAELRRGRPQEARGLLAAYMGQLKVDMRLLSRAASGGDVLVRGAVGISGRSEAKFDYNSGQFELRPIAAQAEEIVSGVNDLYFNELEHGADEALARLQNLNSLFDEWQSAVMTALQ